MATLAGRIAAVQHQPDFDSLVAFLQLYARKVRIYQVLPAGTLCHAGMPSFQDAGRRTGYKVGCRQALGAAHNSIHGSHLQDEQASVDWSKAPRLTASVSSTGKGCLKQAVCVGRSGAGATLQQCTPGFLSHCPTLSTAACIPRRVNFVAHACRCPSRGRQAWAPPSCAPAPSTSWPTCRPVSNAECLLD